MWGQTFCVLIAVLLFVFFKALRDGIFKYFQGIQVVLGGSQSWSSKNHVGSCPCPGAQAWPRSDAIADIIGHYLTPSDTVIP